MSNDATGPSKAQAARRRRARSSWNAIAFGALALASYTLLLSSLYLLLAEGIPLDDAARFRSAKLRKPWEPMDVVEEYELDVVPEEVIVGEEPIALEAYEGELIETDNDLPYDEHLGVGGQSDAPFEGPVSNGSIGVGGGGGGAFKGRGGGCCARGFGGGGRGGRPGAAQDPGKAIENRVHRACRRMNREGYDRIKDNPFLHASEEHTSTFSIDVDTASYANVRRILRNDGRLPPKDAVRIEEMLNYFPYAYDPPPDGATAPFRAHVQVAACPWNAERRLARIAIKGRILARKDRPAANLVFLVDVSGSMSPRNKLPLLKQALAELVLGLADRDRVAIVVYAGAAGLVLPSTPGSERDRIATALSRLESGGSTNGGAGIELAYRIATKHFIEGGTNRVILATDGDFNVGVTNRGDLTRLIEKNAKTGVFLSALGFGTGNYRDGQLEALTNMGNGNYAYIDSLREARKVLVEEAAGTLVTIAKDVKIQVFFNPSRVAGYRLIGYENRLLAKQDFNDDKKDAGEIGAGHAVTALYEIVPKGKAVPGGGTDPNPFVRGVRDPRTEPSQALFRLRLRYKQPDGAKSVLVEQDVRDAGTETGDREFQWAAAVASFGMLLRDSEHKGNATWASVYEMARAARGEDRGGYRQEFLDLVRRAKRAAALERR